MKTLAIAVLMLATLAITMAANTFCTDDSQCPHCAAPSHHFCHFGECHCHGLHECDADPECSCPKALFPKCDFPHCHCRVTGCHADKDCTCEATDRAFCASTGICHCVPH